ncbi:MAG: hypothetical protein ABIQ29_01810 [Burkholderiaceae bacterium]
MTSIRALAALCVAGTLGAQAQTLSGIQLEPVTVKVGEPVRITGRFDNAENPNCHVRLHFGDGQTQDFKINQAKDVPLVASRSFAAPGQYKVMLEPKTALPMFKCVGPNQTAMLTVVAAAPVPSGGRAAATGPQCPPGWKLDAKSVNKKSGAYTCGAKIGAPLPSTKLECAAPLGYFENKFKGQLGCRA